MEVDNHREKQTIFLVTCLWSQRVGKRKQDGPGGGLFGTCSGLDEIQILTV
jgi:hypothetical protein